MQRGSTSATLPSQDGQEAEVKPVGLAVGRYVVLRRLGAGAMGVVYMAYDPELDRKVALKLLQTHTPGDGHHTGQARLLREAQALAKLAHPNVVAVHDVGVHRDTDDTEGARTRVFVAMELIEGVTLGDWLERRARPLRELLDVFLAAARGLAAAHRAGLVHRDFKPDNVMVGADGRVRVMDFGLARSVVSLAADINADTLVDGPLPAWGSLTREGAVLGTPSYMAAEQWSGAEVDARSDQFAFCVALWEAVFGERPFKGATTYALMSAVTRGELAAPAAGRRAPAWLRRALERGLALDPARRFPTMDALLAEIERAQGRWRGRALVAAIAAVGLLAGGTVALRARRAAACTAAGAQIDAVWNDDTSAALHTALRATGAMSADTSFARAVPIVERWRDAWSTTRSQVCHEAEVEGTRPQALYERATACLDERRDALAGLLDVFAASAAADVPRLVPAVAALEPATACADTTLLLRRQELPADPAARLRAHALRRELLGLHSITTAGGCAAIERAQALVAETEALAYTPLSIAARASLGELAKCNGDRAAAEAAFRRVYVEAGAAGSDETAVEAAIELMSVIGGARERATEALQWVAPAEMLVRRLGEERGLPGASLRKTEALVRMNRGDLEGALRRVEQALTIREVVLGPAHPAVASLLDNLGVIQRERLAYDAALAAHRRALAIRREALGPDDPAVARTLHRLGLLEQERGELGEAQALLEQALTIDEAAFGPDDLVVAEVRDGLGRLLHLRGELAAARVHLQAALRVREARLGPDDLDVATTLENLGRLQLVEGDRAGARALLERVLKIREARLPADHPDVATILDSLGTLSHRMGDTARALALHERALASRAARLGPDHVDVAHSRRQIALVRDIRGEHDAARALARAALASAERSLGADHPDLAPFLNTVGLLERRHDPALAEAALTRALAISTAALGPRHPATATALHRLGDVFLDRGAHERAAANFEEALAIREALGPAVPELAEVLISSGELALLRGRPAEAIPLLERALEIRRRPGIPAYQLAQARFALARALRANDGDPSRARALAGDAAAAWRAADPAFRAELAAAQTWLARPD